MPTVKVSEDMYALLYNRAKTEGKKIEALLNQLLNKILWNEPGILFKGKLYKVEPDLFGENEPKQGEIEE